MNANTEKYWKYCRILNRLYILSKHCPVTFSLQWTWTQIPKKTENIEEHWTGDIYWANIAQPLLACNEYEHMERFLHIWINSRYIQDIMSIWSCEYDFIEKRWITFQKNCPFLTCHVIFMFMFCDYDDFDNVNVVALVMQIIFEAGIMMTIKITIQC